MNTSNLSHIPDELVLHISNYLTQNDLARLVFSSRRLFVLYQTFRQKRWRHIIAVHPVTKLDRESVKQLGYGTPGDTIVTWDTTFINAKSLPVHLIQEITVILYNWYVYAEVRETIDKKFPNCLKFNAYFTFYNFTSRPIAPTMLNGNRYYPIEKFPNHTLSVSPYKLSFPECRPFITTLTKTMLSDESMSVFQSVSPTMFVNLSVVVWQPINLTVSDCIWVYKYLQRVPQLSSMEIHLERSETLESLPHLPTGLKSCQLSMTIYKHSDDLLTHANLSISVPQITAMKLEMRCVKIKRTRQILNYLCLPNLNLLKIDILAARRLGFRHDASKRQAYFPLSKTIFNQQSTTSLTELYLIVTTRSTFCDLVTHISAYHLKILSLTFALDKIVNVVFDKRIEQLFEKILHSLSRKSLNINQASLEDIEDVDIFHDKCLEQDVKTAILRPIDELFKMMDGFIKLPVWKEGVDYILDNDLEFHMFQELLLEVLYAKLAEMETVEIVECCGLLPSMYSPRLSDVFHHPKLKQIRYFPNRRLVNSDLWNENLCPYNIDQSDVFFKDYIHRGNSDSDMVTIKSNVTPSDFNGFRSVMIDIEGCRKKFAAELQRNSSLRYEVIRKIFPRGRITWFPMVYTDEEFVDSSTSLIDDCIFNSCKNKATHMGVQLNRKDRSN